MMNANYRHYLVSSVTSAEKLTTEHSQKDLQFKSFEHTARWPGIF